MNEDKKTNRYYPQHGVAESTKPVEETESSEVSIETDLLRGAVNKLERVHELLIHRLVPVIKEVELPCEPSALETTPNSPLAREINGLRQRIRVVFEDIEYTIQKLAI
jgi:hypothetical protein